MNEKTFQTQFNKFIKENFKNNSAFELKITKTKSIRFDAVKPHQIRNLELVEKGQFVYKIPDVGLQPKPFDCLTMNGFSYLVFYFYERGKKTFWIVRLKEFLNQKEQSKKASFTEEDISNWFSFGSVLI
jgi:hypothetical protein